MCTRAHRARRRGRLAFSSLFFFERIQVLKCFILDFKISSTWTMTTQTHNTKRKKRRTQRTVEVYLMLSMPFNRCETKVSSELALAVALRLRFLELAWHF
jgi:hypothetical protein